MYTWKECNGAVAGIDGMLYSTGKSEYVCREAPRVKTKENRKLGGQVVALGGGEGGEAAGEGVARRVKMKSSTGETWGTLTAYKAAWMHHVLCLVPTCIVWQAD